VGPEDPLSEAIDLMLRDTVCALPVVDEKGRVTGLLTEANLFDGAGITILQGLLAEPHRNLTLDALAGRKVADAMSSPAETLQEDDHVGSVIPRLGEVGAGWFPVLDGVGGLAGILRPLDLVKAITRHAPDWYREGRKHVRVLDPLTVGDIVHRTEPTVRTTTPLDEVVESVFVAGTGGVAVLDDGDSPVGFIGEGQLAALFPEHSPGIWELLTRRVTVPGLGSRYPSLHGALKSTCAADIMAREVVTLAATASLEEAAALLAGARIRSLVVVDGAGRYGGVVNRTDILQAAAEAGR